MEAARPRSRRRRPRRGTLERPLNTRLVRVASIVIAPALLALLFSVSTPGTLPPPPLAPLFDGSSAAELAGRLSIEYPARVPGTPEAERAALWYQETISALGLATEIDVWSEELAGLGEVELRNVVTVVPGRSEEAIVLVAHRDNAGTDQRLGDNASGTAALIELARGFAPQEAAPDPRPDRTLVLVSTDAGAYGGAGASHFSSESPHAEDAFAAIVLDTLGGPGTPRLILASDRPASPARALVTTAAARVEEQAGMRPALPSALTQLIDFGIPFATGEQGPLLARGIAALTLTTETPGDRGTSGGANAALTTERLGQLGRATEALVGSIDASVGAFRTPDSLFLDDRVASGWTVRLTLVAAVAPFALGVLDLLVRIRRRRLPLTPALRAMRTRLVLWLYGGLLVGIGALTGLFPSGTSLPLPPYTPFIADWPVAGLAVLSIAFVLGWLAGRRRLVPATQPKPEERLAGYAVALTWLGIVAVVIAVAKPYALVFVLPSLYAWLWLPLRTQLWARGAVYILGLLGPVVGLLVLANEVDLDLVDAPLYVVGLATVGYVSLGSVLLAVSWAAAASQLAALAFGRYAPYAGGVEPPPPGVVRRSVSRLARARAERYVSAR
jgi:peptidase M28-like protein